MSRWLKTGYHTQWIGAGNSFSTLFQVDDNPRKWQDVGNFLESMPLDRDPTDEGIPYPVTVWWDIEIWAYTIYFAPAPIPAPQDVAYNGPQYAWTGQDDPGVPIGFGPANAVRTSPLRFRLRYQNESQRNRFVDVDVGAGIKLAVNSNQIVVEGLVPEGSIAVNEGGPPQSFAPPPGEVWGQSLVCGTISKQDAPIGDRWATLTEPLRAGAGAAGTLLETVKIPMAAKKITIVQTDPGPPGVFNYFSAADATGLLGTPVGSIATNPFTRSSRRTEIPGNASYITLASPFPGGSRRFNLVFELEF